MKIAIVLPSLEVGGAERQMTLLAEYMQRAGHEVDVCVLRATGAFVETLKQPLHSVEKAGRYDLLGPFIRLAKLFKKQQYDAVISCLPSANIYALALKLVSPKTPLVWGVASAQLPLGYYGLWAKIGYFMQQKLAYFADKMVSNSYAGSQAAIDAGYAQEKIEVIHNGVDTDKFFFSISERKAWRERHDIPLDALVVGMVGRLDPAKDHATFFAVIDQLHQRNQTSDKAKPNPDKKTPPLYFVLIGGGDTEYALQQMAIIKQHPLYGKQFKHLAHEQNIAGALSAFDVALMTSISEGLPNTLMEALSCERLCVVTDVGDCKLVVADYGKVCQPGDVNAISDACEQLLRSATEAEADSAPEQRQYIVDNFSMPAMTQQFVALCENLCHSKEQTQNTTTNKGQGADHD